MLTLKRSNKIFLNKQTINLLQYKYKFKNFGISPDLFFDSF